MAIHLSAAQAVSTTVQAQADQQADLAAQEQARVDAGAARIVESIRTQIDQQAPAGSHSAISDPYELLRVSGIPVSGTIGRSLHPWELKPLTDRRDAILAQAVETLRADGFEARSTSNGVRVDLDGAAATQAALATTADLGHT